MSESTDFSALMDFDATPPTGASAARATPSGGGAAVSAGADAVLGHLIERMSRQPDFPALGAAMGGVRRLARDEQTRLQTLSDALLSDVGLAHRVLRMANAAHYRAVGAGEITQLSRAIAVMGWDELSRLALSSRLIDQLRGHHHSQVLRGEFLRALLAGALAHQLAAGQPWAEDAHVAAVFRNLGRLLCGLHLTEQALGVQAELPPGQWPRTLAEQEASVHRLGVSYDQLGQQVAERWGWPAALRWAMRQPSDRRQLGRWPQRSDAPLGLGGEALPPHAAMVSTVAAVANELADLMIYRPPADWPEGCARLAHPQGWRDEVLVHSLQSVGPELDRLGLLLELPRTALPMWQPAPEPAQAPMPVPAPAPAAAGAAAAAEPAGAASVKDVKGMLAGRGQTGPQQPTLEGARGATVTAMGSARAADPPPEATVSPSVPRPREPWMAGTVVPGQALVDRLQRLLAARRVVLCMRDPGRGDLVGRHACSPGLSTWPGQFVVSTAQGQDLFATLAAWGSDTLISDSGRAAIASRLPHWWEGAAGGGSFLVMPLRHGAHILGLIYAEAAQVGELRVDERCRQALAPLREQALQLCLERVLPAGSGAAQVPLRP